MKKDVILKKALKPGRYIGAEYGEIRKDKEKMDARVAFCFPDTYEIGMSNLGMRILWGVLNRMPNVWCERCYAPADDMESMMREENIPLFALESQDDLTCFDVVAFTLQYELSFSNVLNMLDLAGIPLLSEDRGDDCPIIIGGGPAIYNPEPIADFFDVFSIGEGEEALPEFMELYIKMKKEGTYTRQGFLREVSHLEGFYVPSLYEVGYKADGTMDYFRPKYPDVPAKIKKRIIADLDKVYYPDKFVIPYIETVHDRIMLEIFRGCIRGCRFCQAGMTYRPVRHASPDVLNCRARKLHENTGYDEISLTCLSVSDYPHLSELTDELLKWTDDKKVSLSLPSQRADAFTHELMKKISGVRQSGITFAPEAGTQRLRDAINKNLYEEDLFKACNVAFDFGKNKVKLYFMSGLPTETDEDIKGIAELSEKVVKEYYRNPNRVKGKHPEVTLSVSCFIPKPFTAFQWEAQDDFEEQERKQAYLASVITDKRVKYNWHDAKVGHVEAAFARGSRKLCAVLLEAHKMGVKFDAWDEFFSYEKWMAAFKAAGVDPDFYARRRIGMDELLPWDMLEIGVTKAFLKSECKKAYESVTTPNCKEKCAGCGADKLGGKCTWCREK
ncbi:MAG: TIGR03960 family B12-binding radical SAM protein [Ruminococcaceae bacterium]|nr:TIGR03960 family B12-binding radical SAM protein [Oscillospiraceae bacterium]